MATQVTRRHLLGVGLASAAVGLLPGCSGGDGGRQQGSVEGKSKGAMDAYGVGDAFTAGEPLTFSFLFQDNPAYPKKKSWEYFDVLKEKTKVELDLTVVPYADFEQKRSLLISSGDAPMIMAKTYAGQENAFVGGGAILAVSDYVDRMPHYQDKLTKWELEPELDQIRQADGKYYSLQGLHEKVWPDYTLAMRTDLLEEQGIDIPQTWDEVQTALQELKQAHPDSIPFSDRWLGDATLNFAAVPFGTAFGWGIGSGLLFDSESGKFEFAPVGDGHRQMIEYFNGLVADGLMDPESFTQEDVQAERKFANGKSFAICTNAQTLQLYRDAMDDTLGKGKYKIAKIPVPGGPLGEVIRGSRLENGLMLSSKAAERDDFEAMLQFIDWVWYSDEAQAFNKWGVEGEQWEMKDGRYTLKPKYSLKAYGFNPDGEIDIRTDLGYSGGNFTYAGTADIVSSTMVPEELAWQKQMEGHEVESPSPGIPYTATQRQQASLVQTPLLDAVKTASLNFILGKRPLSEWDAYVSELEGKGLQNYVDTANKVYAEAAG